jgi:hypothetical protein
MTCRSASSWLRKNKIVYTEIDIDRDFRAKELLHPHNPRGYMPTFVIDYQVEVGFSAEQLLQMIFRAAQHHLRP